MSEVPPRSERLRRTENRIEPDTRPTLQEYIEKNAGMNWEAFKAKMRSRGIEPGFFAFSRLHQLDPAFIKEMNIAIGIRKEDGAPEYQAALKTAEGDDRNRGADLNGDASSRITRATASLRQTTEDLIANREARESTTSNEKNL